MKKKNWFVTGISRGFGRTLTEELLNEGCKVVGTVRGPIDFSHPNLKILNLDVKDEGQVIKVVDEAIKWLGTIDVLVNNAGYGIVGSIEEVNSTEVRDVFDTNVFGTLNVLRVALPFLRKQKFGYIVNFSSMGGFSALPGYGIYNATKFAVEGLSEALAQEMKPFGIKVIIIEPGAFRTEFLSKKSLVRSAKIISDYNESSGKTRQKVEERNGHQPSDPKLGMRVLMEAIENDKATLRMPLGRDCLERMNQKLKSVIEDIKYWESTSNLLDKK